MKIHRVKPHPEIMTVTISSAHWMTEPGEFTWFYLDLVTTPKSIILPGDMCACTSKKQHLFSVAKSSPTLMDVLLKTHITLDPITFQTKADVSLGMSANTYCGSAYYCGIVHVGQCGRCGSVYWTISPKSVEWAHHHQPWGHKHKFTDVNLALLPVPECVQERFAPLEISGSSFSAVNSVTLTYKYATYACKPAVGPDIEQSSFLDGLFKSAAKSLADSIDKKLMEDLAGKDKAIGEWKVGEEAKKKFIDAAKKQPYRKKMQNKHGKPKPE